MQRVRESAMQRAPVAARAASGTRAVTGAITAVTNTAADETQRMQPDGPRRMHGVPDVLLAGYSRRHAVRSMQ